MELMTDVLGFFTPTISDDDLAAQICGDELLPNVDVDVDISSLVCSPGLGGDEDPLGVFDDETVGSFLGYSPGMTPPESPEDMFVPQGDRVVKMEPDSSNPLNPLFLVSMDTKDATVPNGTNNPTKLELLDLATSVPQQVITAPPVTKTPAPVATTTTTANSTPPKNDVTAANSTSSKRTFTSTEEDNADNADDTTVKKQRRMQKNRESAMLSRQRKKAHLEGLEKENQKLVVENSSLVKDKENLHAKVKSLETENTKLREELSQARGHPSTSTVLGALNGNGKTTTLMMCLLCFGLFGSPGSLLQPQSSTTSLHANTSERMGRTLKTVDVLHRPATLAPPRSHVPAVEVPKTEMQNVPKTEMQVHQQIDLHQQLVGRLKTLTKFEMERTNPSEGSIPSGTDLVPSSGSSVEQMQQEWQIPPVFRLDHGLTAPQIRSITKRSDTSYVFCTEVQMIAAATLNPDGIPRMSVVMPTPDSKPTSINGNQSVSMIQVDCNVAESRAIRLSTNSSVV